MSIMLIVLVQGSKRHVFGWPFLNRETKIRVSLGVPRNTSDS